MTAVDEALARRYLVTALCRDVVVQRAFPDGIAWITIGREWDGDFVMRMREVARALGDDLSGYDNPLACENRYRAFLREKAALEVLDDVSESIVNRRYGVCGRSPGP